MVHSMFLLWMAKLLLESKSPTKEWPGRGWRYILISYSLLLYETYLTNQNYRECFISMPKGFLEVVGLLDLTVTK